MFFSEESSGTFEKNRETFEIVLDTSYFFDFFWVGQKTGEKGILVPNYATKQQVINTRNDILNDVKTLCYTKNEINDNYYSKAEHNTYITTLEQRILALEQRIATLESKHSNN